VTENSAIFDSPPPRPRRCLGTYRGLSKARGCGKLSTKQMAIRKKTVSKLSGFFAACRRTREGFSLPISVRALNEEALPIRFLPIGIPASGAVTSAARRITAGAALLLFTLLLFVPLASQAEAATGHLLERLTPEVMAIVWPGAEKLGPEEGKPSAIEVYRDGKVIGYVFSTLDVVEAQGYSSTPFDVIAGVDLTGRISGAKVIFHREPHVYQDEIRQPQLDTFLARTAGLASQGKNPGALTPDYVAGATVTARAMRDAVFESAQLVLIGRGLAKPRASATGPSGPVVDVDGFTQMSWDDMLAEGSIVHKVITGNDVAAALRKANVAGGKLDVPASDPNGTYIDIYTGLATPASIGRNVLGSSYQDYFGPRGRSMRFLPSKIFVASKGPYDFVDAHRFDRLRVVQGDQTYKFTSSQYQQISTGGHDGIRALDHAAVFTLAAAAQFDPLKPWRLELLVNGETGAGSPISLAFPVNYQLPASHILMPPRPAWMEAWSDSRTNVIIEAVLLTLLTLILVFQTKLAQSRRAHRIIRNSFLLFVLVWQGWIAGGQLSILNVINYMHAPFRHFELGFYLAEPLMVMIVIYTAISLVLLGRGVFCGWLCPFGALQELLAQLSRFIGLPNWNPPESVQKYLWLGKYVSAALVLGLAAFSVDMGARVTEIEPFNTAITSHFTRAWPYVFYACALLMIGLFTERAYCRFLCPLGGVLALADRLHLLNLLKRRPECGSSCHLCENSCPVKAISRSGKINTAECFHCLDCQVEYFDDRRCPPLAAIRKRSIRPTGGDRIPAGAVAAVDRI
jgi:NosR/NirI family nitrous oxide reductase transcriptional regulator